MCVSTISDGLIVSGVDKGMCATVDIDEYVFKVEGGSVCTEVEVGKSKCDVIASLVTTLDSGVGVDICSLVSVALVCTGPVEAASVVVTGSSEVRCVIVGAGSCVFAASPPKPTQVEKSGQLVSNSSFWNEGALLTFPALRLMLMPTLASNSTPAVLSVPQTPPFGLKVAFNLASK